MDRPSMIARMVRSMRAFYRLAGPSSPEGRVIEMDGLTAALVPSVPERSVLNAVVYDDTGTLLDSYRTLATEYREAGIRAWTVWVPEGDTRAAGALSDVGHMLDATPEAMMRDLERLEEPPPGVLGDWTRGAPIPEVMWVNDRSYRFEGDPFTRAWSAFPADQAHAYVARLDGRPVASVLTCDHDGDCGVYAVATVPEARGRGLARALMRQALLDAAGRGCATTSLQATKLGRPVYERLGYRSLGPVGMWERRE